MALAPSAARCASQVPLRPRRTRDRAPPPRRLAVPAWLRSAAALVGCLAAAHCCSGTTAGNGAYALGPARQRRPAARAEAAGEEDAPWPAAAPRQRRGFLMAAGANALAALGGTTAGAGAGAPAARAEEEQPAAAAEAPKPKRPPQYLMVTGRKGELKEINGRWTILFGKKLNDKVVYKRDGEDIYLMYNNCGEFQMDYKVKGDCGGIAVQKTGTWRIKGVEDPNIQVKPVDKNAKYVPPPDEVKPTTPIKDALRKEAEAMNREINADKFRGVLEEGDEQVGDRLMLKMGAKIVDGM